jgi:hypothetical protein
VIELLKGGHEIEPYSLKDETLDKVPLRKWYNCWFDSNLGHNAQ